MRFSRFTFIDEPCGAWQYFSNQIEFMLKWRNAILKTVTCTRSFGSFSCFVPFDFLLEKIKCPGCSPWFCSSSPFLMARSLLFPVFWGASLSLPPLFQMSPEGVRSFCSTMENSFGILKKEILERQCLDLGQGCQTHFHRGPPQPCSCLQRA